MITSRRHFLHTSLATTAALAAMPAARAKQPPPNFLFILTDDQRHTALGCAGNPLISTPALDALAAQGAHFKNAFVTTSICSPSRACCLTGRYGSANGVVTFGNPKLNQNEKTFAHILKQAGYKTGMVGKWHLGNTPQECGFDYAAYFKSNGTYYNRKVNEFGEPKTAEGYIEEYNTTMSTRFLRESKQAGKPFALFHCTQIPHMNHAFEWVAKEKTKKQYPINTMPLPKTWQDDLAGKPPYLKTGRNRQQALQYGYDKAHNIRAHFRDYYAAITEMDATLGTLLQKLDDLGMRDNTYIIFMGDNGWFMGEHGFTSKVLPYEESIRVPMILAGPGIQHQTDHHLVLNADLAPTLLDLAGLPIPKQMQGTSLAPLLKGEPTPWRQDFLYEAPVSQLGSWPLYAIRTHRWKYIQTYAIDQPKKRIFEELYDLRNDPTEMHNVVNKNQNTATVNQLRQRLNQWRKDVMR